MNHSKYRLFIVGNETDVYSSLEQLGNHRLGENLRETQNIIKADNQSATINEKLKEELSKEPLNIVVACRFTDADGLESFIGGLKEHGASKVIIMYGNGKEKSYKNAQGAIAKPGQGVKIDGYNVYTKGGDGLIYKPNCATLMSAYALLGIADGKNFWEAFITLNEEKKNISQHPIKNLDKKAKEELGSKIRGYNSRGDILGKYIGEALIEHYKGSGEIIIDNSLTREHISQNKMLR